MPNCGCSTRNCLEIRGGPQIEVPQGGKRVRRSPNWTSYATKSHSQEALKVFSKQFL
jgi:hypothetical protein